MYAATPSLSPQKEQALPSQGRLSLRKLNQGRGNSQTPDPFDFFKGSLASQYLRDWKLGSPLSQILSPMA